MNNMVKEVLRIMDIEKKEWSVKISLFKSDYNELQRIAYNLDFSLKKLVNKSIKYALKDYKINKSIKRKDRIQFLDDELKVYSFKIKEKHYNKLKEIADKIDMNVKELVKSILSYYPILVEECEENLFEDIF
ncbi:hypothetical protein RWZ02_15735 [Clostridium butyricum]|uniref:hypothetical protein n=1 Tax=Clostridium butyricum TaxID=1492 RepID=UPI0028FD92E3|nr:hypothetical protein [Clostridium butyricum]MDU0324125.1 hypothetical protein [Clostridium butyricum]